MKKMLLGLLLCATALYSNAQDANAPVKIRQSDEFDTPNRYDHLALLPYNDIGMFNFCRKGVEEYNIQWFGKDLKLKSEKDFNLQSNMSENANSPLVLRIGKKVYLTVRDVNKDKKTEGISVLEFFPEQMSFATKEKKLFESEGKVAFWQSNNNSLNWASSFGSYSAKKSENEKFLLVTYKALPEIRNNKINITKIGMYVFDQDMNKVWGKEVSMPLPEAKMANVDYMISNEGKVYMTAKVFTRDTPAEESNKKTPNYHLELMSRPEISLLFNPNISLQFFTSPALC